MAIPIHYISFPSEKITGVFYPPGDKSITHRAILLGSIAEKESLFIHPLLSQDTWATFSAMRAMGVSIEQTPQHNLHIKGVGLYGLKAPKDPIDCGNSGTTMRLLAGLLAAQSFFSSLTGDESLRKRPMQRVMTPLQAMGADITGYPPLDIRPVKELKGIRYSLPIASAQVKSAILLASLYAKGKTEVREPIPTRDHTERLLTAGIRQGGEFLIPGDFSSAAFFIVAALITPRSALCVRNVGLNPFRIGLLNIIKRMGGNINVIQNYSTYEPIGDIEVHYTPVLYGTDIHPLEIAGLVDELPILSIAAACAKGVTRIRGAQELRYKESDRIRGMVQGLQQVGIRVEEFSDGLMIEGGTFQAGVVNSGGDHRIAMAFAIAGAVAKGSITLQDCANVETSFPNFKEQANQVGLNIQLLKESIHAKFDTGHHL